MEKLKRKATGILLILAVLISAVLPAGCNARLAKDIDEIEDTVQQFIDAFAAGDQGDVEELIDGDFAYSYQDKDKAEIMLKMSSRSEIESFKSVEVDRKSGTARARFKISYIDSTGFSARLKTTYMTKEEYLNEIDSYDDMETANLSFSFVYDKDEGRWLIKESSAEKYEKLFSYTYWIYLAAISEDQAMEIFSGVISGLAEGNLNQPYFELGIDDFKIFYGTGYDFADNDDAVLEFAKAYYSYILDHGYTVEMDHDTPYSAIIRGYAPAEEEILGYLTGDEHLTEMYMAEIREWSGSSKFTPVQIWSDYYRETYLDLAKRIPGMESELYTPVFYINPMDSDPEINFSDTFFPRWMISFYSADSATYDQILRCRKKAAEALFYAGEITQQQYDAYLQEFVNDTGTQNSTPGGSSSDNGYIVWDGTTAHANQAVNVHEYAPDWADGTLAYGESEADRRGIFMTYSKEPGWLDTAGYNISDESVTVMLRYDRRFKAGTTLEYDWYVNGNHYGDKGIFTVENDGTNEFEFTLPEAVFDKYGTCEFRLWEEGHAHVIAYVKLTKT